MRATHVLRQNIKMNMRDILRQVRTRQLDNEIKVKLFQAQVQHIPCQRVDLKQAVSLLKRSPTESGDITAFVLDYYLLLVRIMPVGFDEDICTYTEPIPWELLTILETDDRLPAQSAMSLSAAPIWSLLAQRSKTRTIEKKREAYPIIFFRPSQLTGNLILENG